MQVTEPEITDVRDHRRNQVRRTGPKPWMYVTRPLCGLPRASHRRRCSQHDLKPCKLIIRLSDTHRLIRLEPPTCPDHIA